MKSSSFKIDILATLWITIGLLYYLIYYSLNTNLINFESLHSLLAIGPFVKMWFHKTWWVHMVTGILILLRIRWSVSFAYMVSALYVLAMIGGLFVVPYFRFTLFKIAPFIFYGVNLFYFGKGNIEKQFVKGDITEFLWRKFSWKKWALYIISIIIIGFLYTILTKDTKLKSYFIAACFTTIMALALIIKNRIKK